MEIPDKRKHSPYEAFAERTASPPVVPEREPVTHRKLPKPSPCTDPAKNAENDASVQDPGTSVEAQPPDADTSAVYKCSICLVSSRRNEMKSLPCFHSFHPSCIDSWLTEHRSCPVCRHEAVPPQNARPPSNNQRQPIFEGLQALPGRRTVTNNVRFSNGDFMRINNDGIDMRLNNGIIRVNNGITRINNIITTANNSGIDIRLNNGMMRMNNNIMRMNNNFSRMYNNFSRMNNNFRRMNNGGTMRMNNNFMRINNGGTMMMNNGGSLMMNNGATLMNNGGIMMMNNGGTLMMNNGGTMMISNGGVDMRLNNGGFTVLTNGEIRRNNFNI